MLAFDNMSDRKITGSSDWTMHEVVLDVADIAKHIAFGILLSGAGQVWLAAVRLETVGTDVPTTGSAYPDSPINLDFSEQGADQDQ